MTNQGYQCPCASTRAVWHIDRRQGAPASDRSSSNRLASPTRPDEMCQRTPKCSELEYMPGGPCRVFALFLSLVHVNESWRGGTSGAATAARWWQPKPRRNASQNEMGGSNGKGDPNGAPEGGPVDQLHVSALPDAPVEHGRLCTIARRPVRFTYGSRWPPRGSGCVGNVGRRPWGSGCVGNAGRLARHRRALAPGRRNLALGAGHRCGARRSPERTSVRGGTDLR